MKVILKLFINSLDTGVSFFRYLQQCLEVPTYMWTHVLCICMYVTYTVFLLCFFWSLVPIRRLFVSWINSYPCLCSMIATLVNNVTIAIIELYTLIGFRSQNSIRLSYPISALSFVQESFVLLRLIWFWGAAENSSHRKLTNCDVNNPLRNKSYDVAPDDEEEFQITLILWKMSPTMWYQMTRKSSHRVSNISFFKNLEKFPAGLAILLKENCKYWESLWDSLGSWWAFPDVNKRLILWNSVR